MRRAAKEAALDALRKAPRVELDTPRGNPGSYTEGGRVSRIHNKAGKGHNMIQKAAKPPLGYIFGDWFTPWQRRFPGDPHLNKDVHLKREYPPISLLELQRMVDTGLLDPSRPIDLAALCATKEYGCQPMRREFGVQLTSEGEDCLATPLDLEVQYADEVAIAAVERAGGRVTAAYYDPVSLLALVDPEAHFRSATPIPRRLFPPPDIVQLYTQPERRGYLADPVAVAAHRRVLAQRYGYAEREPEPHIAAMPRKDPLQVFYGLRPGWLVSLPDKAILKAKDAPLQAHYDPDANSSSSSS